MNRRTMLQLLTSLTLSGGLAAQGTPASAQEECSPTRTAWVAEVLEQMQTIMPGMTRNTLLQVFTTEGGIASRQRRTYVSRACPFFKVDAVFQASQALDRPPRNEDWLEEDGQDVIVSISRPYLQFSIMD